MKVRTTREVFKQGLIGPGEVIEIADEPRVMTYDSDDGPVEGKPRAFDSRSMVEVDPATPITWPRPGA
jgi:hypothetical protein